MKIKAFFLGLLLSFSLGIGAQQLSYNGFLPLSGGTLTGAFAVTNGNTANSAIIVTQGSDRVLWSGDGTLSTRVRRLISSSSTQSMNTFSVSAGTTNFGVNSFGQATVSSSTGPATNTHAATIECAGVPIAGTDITQTNTYCIRARAGLSSFEGGVAVSGGTWNVTSAGAISGLSTIANTGNITTTLSSNGLVAHQITNANSGAGAFEGFVTGQNASTQTGFLYYLNSGATVSGLVGQNMAWLGTGSAASSGMLVNTGAAAPIVFATGGTAAANERMRVDASGLKLAVYTVGTLPTCNAGAKYAMAAVSDATAPTYNATVTGGGAVAIPVMCDGANWTAH